MRKDRNLTQTELASNIGIQQSDLCRIETGEYKVSLDLLFRILSTFQINIAEFFHEHPPSTLTERDVDFVREFHRLDTRAQREVWEFIRFKLQGSAEPEAQPEHGSSSQENGPDE